MPGPGQYNYADEFARNIGKVTVGVRREEESCSVVGPGHYSPERAERLVYPHSREVDFGSMPKRIFTEEEMAIGPGSYNPQPKFGDDTRDMTIGLARKFNYDNGIPGPGFYQHERADNLVKPNAEISLLDL